MKTNRLVTLISLSLILIALILSCSTDTSEPTPQKPTIDVEVFISGNYLTYELNRTSGSEVKKFLPGDKIKIKQGDKLFTFLGLPNKEQGTINYYQVTDSTRVFLTGLTRVGQFSLEFNY